jgi:hypothetical protein
VAKDGKPVAILVARSVAIWRKGGEFNDRAVENQKLKAEKRI